MDNLVKKGFDVVTMFRSIIVEKLYQYCLKFHGNMMKASEMALYAAPVHIALSYGIPLMFYGENPAHTIGEKQEVNRRRYWYQKRIRLKRDH